MLAGERGENFLAQLFRRAGDEGADETFAAFKVMQDGGMRDADVARNVLQADAFGALRGEALLGGIQYQAAGLVGGTADALYLAFVCWH